MSEPQKRTLHLSPDNNAGNKVTFEDVCDRARIIMTLGAAAAAKQTGMKNSLRETRLANGGIRIVIVWDDGEETNDCIVEPNPKMN